MNIINYTDDLFDELCAFLKKWTPDHPELGHGDIIKWQICDRYVAIEGGRIVGYIAQIPHSYKYSDGRQQMLGWGVTLVLDMSDDKIRKEAGRKLLAVCETKYPYAAVGVVDIIEEPYKRRGHAVKYDWCNMYSRFIKPSRPLKYIGKPQILSPAIMVVNFFRKYPGIFIIDKKDGEFIRDYLPNDERIDSMLKFQYSLYSARSNEYIRYKIKQPNKEYIVLGNDDGYIIFRQAINYIKGLFAVRICDIAAIDQQTMIRLLEKAVYYAEDIGADAVIGIDSVQDADAYSCAGLWIKKPYRIVVPPNLTEPMRITMFDSDLDNLW